MRSLTAEQLELVSARETMPIYLVELAVSGVELMSTCGDRVIGNQLYVGGDIGVGGIDNWSSARVRLRATPARVQQVLAAAWRGGTCRIWLLPSRQYPQLIEPGYYEDGCVIEGFYAVDPILLLDGVLTSAQIREWVEFDVSHRAAIAKWAPSLRIAAPLCNHLPRPGTTIVWQGDNYTLEAR